MVPFPAPFRLSPLPFTSGRDNPWQEGSTEMILLKEITSLGVGTRHSLPIPAVPSPWGISFFPHWASSVYLPRIRDAVMGWEGAQFNL